MDPFTYEAAPMRVVFGNGEAAALPAEAERLAVSCALVLCSPSRAALAGALAASLGANRASVCDASAVNIPQASFDRALAAIGDSGADGLVALGGGSPIGLGKALAAATRLPLIALPTTYSGSEMAPNWYVGTGPSRRVGADRHALPRTVIYDPALTVELPPAMSAASGMNAMAHATESLYGPDTNPVVQALAEDAIRTLGAALPRVVSGPSDPDARAEALYGAFLAAAFRATSGLEHAVAQRLRRRFDLGHAAAHAVVVPYAIAFNRDAAPDAMRRIERALGVDDAPSGLWRLNRTLGIATGLKAFGLSEADIDEAVEAVGALDFPNPRPVSRAGLRDVIAQAIAGAPPAC